MRRADTVPRRAWLATLFLLAFATNIWALRPDSRPLPDHDSAGGIKVGPQAGAPIPADRESAITALEARIGARTTISWNGISGAPRNLVAPRPLTDPSDDAPGAIARAFIAQNRAIWGFTSAEVAALRENAVYTDRHNGASHVFFTQMAHGVPVFPGAVGVHLDGRGRVIGVGGDVFPRQTQPPKAILSAGAALEAAAASIGVSMQAVPSGKEGDEAIFEAGPLMSPVRVSPVIYPLMGTPILGWRMTVEKNGLEWYDMIVDARSGEVLHRRNLYQFTSQVVPSAPAEPAPAAPRGLIYPDHPLMTIRGTGDLIRRYPFTADPTGRPHGFANAPLNGADTVTTIPHGGNPANATIAQVELPLPDAANPLRSNALPVSTSPQSPQGWFIKQGSNFMTIGNNVDAKDDQAGDNEASIGMRANGGVTGDFAGPAFVYQNNYGANGPYSTAAARRAAAAVDLNAATLNLFYMNNWYHDFLYHLGFTEAAGNFQQDNFGRGGLGGDFVFADAQDGSGTNNANFGTPSDGSNPRMQMFLFTSPERDGDFDGDVIIHEYTHGLSNRLVGGPNNVGCLGTPLVGESGSMGEGWGDWYAGVIMDEAALGEYATGNGSVAIRRFSMDRGPNDFTYGFLCSGPPSNPSLIACEVHDGGEFWSIVLWEMREAMINRFHNRAYPATPFPTFTGDFPEGNIRNAQGRTIDGSGSPSQIDFESIEKGSFTALFRVTDAMKFAPCNPTMVDMRDAILTADRVAGGEFQDLIWRAFTNRGIGELATSTGGVAPAIVEDFVVPPEVEACESAGGPPAAPSFTAVSTVANTVDITITPSGAAEYVIFRGLDGAGSDLDPAAFVEVGRTTGTSFTDTGLDGGVTYTYRVRAARNDSCVSPSQAIDVVPLGDPIPCAQDPTFLGLARAIDAGDCERVLLDWAPGRSNCTGGPVVKYHVYRSTDPAFVPGPANRVASGVVGNSYVDMPGAVDTLFYYTVRAEDSTVGNAGPGGGNEEENTVRRSALVTSGVLVNSGFEDDVETGPDGGRSARFTSSGLAVPTIPERGGWFRDSNPDPVVPHSGSTVWHTFDADNQPLSPGDSLVFELRSDVVTITESSILTFWHTFQSEGSFDGGVLEVATVIDEVTGAVGPFEDVGHLIYENGYNGVLDAPENTNPLANRPAWTGGVLGPMQRVRVFVGGLLPPGESSRTIVIRFLFGNDVANTIPPDDPEGNFLPGWYIDDISIDTPCCPLSDPPTDLTAAATADGEITLGWNAPTGGPTDEYQVYREQVSEAIPSVFTNRIATIPGTQTSYVDDTVAAGVTYAYVVRGVRTGGCPSGESNVATATGTGSCTAPPFFSGLRTITAPPEGSCQLRLAWEAGSASCPGETVRYNVYRSPAPGFMPNPGSLLVSGLTGLSYVDADLVPGTTYHYVVRAEDTIGNEESNLLRLSSEPLGALGPGPDFSDDAESGVQPGYSTFSTRSAGGWQILSDATAHSPTEAWVALDDQPGAPTLTQKDDRLTLPAMNLTSASTLTFWHNFDFAQFPASSAATRYQSGGVLEISADGDTWIDLGAWIVSGGYNGVMDHDAQNPLQRRPAWVGSSDVALGNRSDAMQQVQVDLGTAIQDLYEVTVLPGARVRFRLGGTFQILLGGVQGSGWGVDDLLATNLLTPGVCITDRDLDGTGDASDCKPLDATLETAAGPVTGISITDLGASGSEVAWDSQDDSAGSATTYDIVAGVVGDLQPDNGFASAVCAADDHPDTPLVDPRPIGPGEMLYWLIRAVNDCNSGPTSYGTSQAPVNYRAPLDAGSPCSN